MAEQQESVKAAATEAQKTQEQVIDRDYPLEPVPMSAREGLIPLSAVLLGLTFFSPTMLAGGNIAAAFPFGNFLSIMLVGNLILGLYVAVMAVIGSQTGLTSALFSRYTLGFMGAKWASFLLGGTQVGWYAVSAAYISNLYVLAFNMPNSYVFWTIFWCVIIGITTIYGFKAMTIVSYVAIPLILILTIWAPILAIEKAGSWNALFQIAPSAPGSMTFTTALTIIVGTFISAGTQVANWSRFGRTAKASFIAAFVAFFLGNGLMIFAGGIGAVAFQQSDMVEVFLKMGIVVWAVLILTLNIWTTNDAGAYAFGVAGAEFFNRPNKTPFIIGGVAISTVLAVSGAYNFFIPFLIMLGVFIPPLGGVIIGDFAFNWKGKLPPLDKIEFKNFKIANLLAYIAGVAASWVSQSHQIGIPPLHGIAVALILVPVLSAIFKNDHHTVKA